MYMHNRWKCEKRCRAVTYRKQLWNIPWATVLVIIFPNQFNRNELLWCFQFSLNLQQLTLHATLLSCINTGLKKLTGDFRFVPVLWRKHSTHKALEKREKSAELGRAESWWWKKKQLMWRKILWYLSCNYAGLQWSSVILYHLGSLFLQSAGWIFINIFLLHKLQNLITLINILHQYSTIFQHLQISKSCLELLRNEATLSFSPFFTLCFSWYLRISS